MKIETKRFYECRVGLRVNINLNDKENEMLIVSLLFF